MSRINPATRRDNANELLQWLVANNYTEWEHTRDILLKAWEALHIPVYELWHAYDLLRVLGRIELISPNGRKGARLLNSTSVELPITVARKCEAKRCPLVKAMLRTFPELKDGLKE